MICPKCNHRQQDDLRECQQCGVIFAKIRPSLHKTDAAAVSEKGKEQEYSAKLSLSDVLFSTGEDINIFFWGGRALLFAVLVWLGFRCIFSPIAGNYAGASFLHLINLPFHEAGHIFLRPFGSLITSLGGSLFQLLVPLVCFFAFLIQTRDTFAASVAMWWFGQNFIDLAPYINDARSLSLPLVGGNFGHSSPYGFHDWEFILTETGLLQYDHVMAKTADATGTLLILFSLVWGAILLYKQYGNLE